jgi:pilus assembly protein FimV
LIKPRPNAFPDSSHNSTKSPAENAPLTLTIPAANTLTPRLASPEIYPALGFRFNPALTGARLNIQTRANGRHVLEVVSVRPLNEPYVYLLVELESDATRIVRGYTALLDPPGYRAPRPAPAAEYLPAVVPPAATALAPATVRAPARDRIPSVARPAPRADHR